MAQPFDRSFAGTPVQQPTVAVALAAAWAAALASTPPPQTCETAEATAEEVASAASLCSLLLAPATDVQSAGGRGDHSWRNFAGWD